MIEVANVVVVVYVIQLVGTSFAIDPAVRNR